MHFQNYEQYTLVSTALVKPKMALTAEEGVVSMMDTTDGTGINLVAPPAEKYRDDMWCAVRSTGIDTFGSGVVASDIHDGWKDLKLIKVDGEMSDSRNSGAINIDTSSRPSWQPSSQNESSSTNRPTPTCRPTPPCMYNDNEICYIIT